MSIEVNVSDWKGMLDCAKMYMTEATIHIGDKKAWILEIDDTKTNLVFVEIACDGEADFTVNLEKFGRALIASGADPVIDVEEGYLRIEGTARVKVPLVVKENKVRWPDKFKESIASCDIAPSQLDPVLSYGQFCNQSVVRFTLGDTRMNIQVGTGADMSEITSLSTAVGESMSVFSLPLIQSIMKLTKGLESVTVHGFGNNMPMIFTWATGTGVYRILIAPFIDEDNP